ncbi:MAG: hypothetical protein PUD22_10900 [Erysipelotrichaceae bacterium]|nr:hypothetical protein [Erysipelotrichaceae bacterium]
MADILLLEPGYANKYPPIGLMKISYFHKYIHHDYVRFAKGRLPEAFKDKKWDRVYVTTLFTFEWKKTKEALEYALSVVKDQSQVYTGGILATLMPELIASEFPMVKNNTGLLDKKGTLGLEHEECIDRLTLDYGILDDIKDQYVYPAHDAYFTYMTRGCGMKCGFCAVQTLEPEYYPYISIKETIKRVDEQFGPKKDLLLMDNNVLRSPRFDQIIDEIIELGFGKGAMFKHPQTGRMVPRYVDFNQGLDAKLLNEHKARRLGELSIRPARIAFDHIEDEEDYKRAIRLCGNSGIEYMSNYLLYNAENFTGKGHSYQADTPEDLYQRMHISMELQEELTESTGHKVAIFSFPMRYIPLTDLERGFVGKNWNKKYLRALQRMLIPTQGKGVSSRSFFEADFGKTTDEFLRFLAMPEEHLGYRGMFIEKKKESKEESLARKRVWDDNQLYLSEWNRLYDLLDDKSEFIDLIGDNKFVPEKLTGIKNPITKKLYIHYLTKTGVLKVFLLEESDTRSFVKEYICNEFPIMYERLLQHIMSSHVQQSLVVGLLAEFKEEIIKNVLERLDYAADEHYLINAFYKAQKKLGKHYFDFNLVKGMYLYHALHVFEEFEERKIIEGIECLDEEGTRKRLLSAFDIFKSKVLKNVTDNQIGAEYIIQQVEQQLTEVYKQLSIFDVV